LAPKKQINEKGFEMALETVYSNILSRFR